MRYLPHSLLLLCLLGCKHKEQKSAPEPTSHDWGLGPISNTGSRKTFLVRQYSGGVIEGAWLTHEAIFNSGAVTFETITGDQIGLAGDIQITEWKPAGEKK